MNHSDEALRNYKRITGSEPPATSTPLLDATLEFVFAKVWNTPGLTWRERRLVSIACAAVNAHIPALETHVSSAVKSGDCTVEELQALSVHVAAYAGFPAGAAIAVSLTKL